MHIEGVVDSLRAEERQRHAEDSELLQRRRSEFRERSESRRDERGWLSRTLASMRRQSESSPSPGVWILHCDFP